MSTQSPERARLADAIERVTAAEAAIADIDRAFEALGYAWHFDGPIAEAAGVLAAARQHEPQRLVDALLGRPLSGTPSVAEAQAALDELRAEADRRRAARHILEQEQSAAQERLHYAIRRRDEALREALAADPAIIALRQEYEATRQRTADLRAMLGVAHQPGLPYPTPGDARPADGVDAPMRVAVAALTGDADAALPGQRAPARR